MGRASRQTHAASAADTGQSRLHVTKAAAGSSGPIHANGAASSDSVEQPPVHGAAERARLIADDKEQPLDTLTCLLTVLPNTTSLYSNTHRGARTHDHKVKGLVVYRLS